MSKHNPGPWTISHQNGDGLPEFEGLVGVVGPEQTNSRGNKFTLYVAQYIKPEDAKLIVAVHDLLESLQDLVNIFQYDDEASTPGTDAYTAIMMAKAAIAKAEA